MRFMDVLRDVLYLFFALLFVGILIFILLIMHVILYPQGIKINVGLPAMATVILFGILGIALAVIIVYGYIPGVIREGEEEE